MEDEGYTLINDNLEITAGRQVTIFLNKNVAFKNIIVNNNATLRFIGDYEVYVADEFTYDQVEMFVYAQNIDLHGVGFLGVITNELE